MVSIRSQPALATQPTTPQSPVSNLQFSSSNQLQITNYSYAPATAIANFSTLINFLAAFNTSSRVTPRTRLSYR